jgi:hypothetical protein
MSFCCDSVLDAKVILRKFKNKLYRVYISGDADKVNLKYTDSGLIKVILISPKMLDFATVSFPLLNSQRYRCYFV